MVSPERQQGAGATRPGRIPHARRGRREYRTDVSFVKCRFAGPRKPLKISPASLPTFVRTIPPPRIVLPERFMSALALSRPSRIVAKGLEQLDRGEYLTHEEVGESIERMFRA